MQWQFPESFPKLGIGEVHIWRVPLIRTEKELIEFKKILNQEEQDRAAKFKVKGAANSFMVARAILRKLLSGYLQIFPHDVVFQQNQYGKLYLDSSPLQFNLSHSRDLALFIFALNTTVGIDVEFVREDYEFTDIASKFFSRAESEALFSLPKNEQLQAFFNCWTCKEAFIKAKGVGLFCALDDFSVEVTSVKQGKMKLDLPNDELDSHGWFLEAIDPGDTYSGAFAIGARNYLVNFYSI